MDLGHNLFFSLCGLALLFQVAAIATRKLYLSLFFSFLYALFVGIILLALGRVSLAIACLWLIAGVSYLALLVTALLIGSHNHQKPERQISPSFFVYLGILLFLAATLSPFFSDFKAPPLLASSRDDFGLIYLILAIVGVLCFMGSLLLMRRDDPSDTR